MLASRTAHVAVVRAFSCSDAVHQLARLESFFNSNVDENGFAAEDKSLAASEDSLTYGACCSSSTVRRSILAFGTVTVLSAVALISAAGEHAIHLGCADVVVHCQLGANSAQQVKIELVQSSSLATGCRFSESPSSILAQCFTATVEGIGDTANDFQGELVFC